MERGTMMLIHSIIIALLLYVIMIYGLNQRPIVAENRSILLGAVILIYMIVFGHGLPGSINKDLF
jgi:TRAP-type C4-dicarboxylate transport system permease small subunit